MDKFIVSARKYRPQTFSTVVGQQHITTTLKNAILNNTLAHAFLFCGPRGVGKTTCARILAKTINCENLQPDGEACNTCRSCTSFNEGTSLNIHELDAASNNSVDDIRELVTQIRFQPQEGKYKIYIIDEVHMLSASAFNAFLKTLEEPPPYAKFILATTEKHKILPTILSRCQIFDFKRITNADTVLHLEEIAANEHIVAEKAALQLISQKSEGCMRDALSLLDKIVSFTSGQLTYANTLEHLNLLDEDYFFQMLDAVLAQDMATALLLYDQINRKGFEGDVVLNGFAECLRNLLMCKDAKAIALLDVLEGMQDRYKAAAQKCSLSFLLSAINVMGEAEVGLKVARNRRLAVELCLIKLCYLQQAIDLAVGQQGQVIQKKRIDGPVAVRSRHLDPLAIAPQRPAAGASLSVQTPGPIAKAAPLPTTPPKPAPALSSTHTPPAMPANVVAPQAAPIAIAPPASSNVGAVPPGRKPSLLDNLRNQQQNQAVKKVETIRRPLNQQEVLEQWDSLLETVRTQNKPSTVTSMQMARLAAEEDTLVITCDTSLNKRFIESEMTDWLTALKIRFANPDISIKIDVVEGPVQEKEIDPKYLSSHERFKLMAEHYPMLKELKDKLRLEIKY